MVLFLTLGLIGGGLAASGLVFNHEQKTMKVGSSAVKKEHMEHESWNAVVDVSYTESCVHLNKYSHFLLLTIHLYVTELCLYSQCFP